MAARLTIAELRETKELALGPTDWHLVSQDAIDLFARATGDAQWIHVEPERAALGPFKGTIAHGYLTLSLLSLMVGELLEIPDAQLVVNYGINRLRFTMAVSSGSEIRLHATLSETEPRGEGVLLTLGVEMEIRDALRPAFVGEALFLAL
jgi:acyl dehydratase